MADASCIGGAMTTGVNSPVGVLRWRALAGKREICGGIFDALRWKEGIGGTAGGSCTLRQEGICM